MSVGGGVVALHAAKPPCSVSKGSVNLNEKNFIKWRTSFTNKYRKAINSQKGDQGWFAMNHDSVSSCTVAAIDVWICD